MRVWLVLLSCVLSFCLLPADLWASPTFLNRQAYHLHLVLTDIGQFHKNDLKTFEVWTQWNNPSSKKIVVKLTFTIVLGFNL